MPWAFVLIWSTGFVVARYAMPHAPALHFLMLRYLLSVLALSLGASSLLYMLISGGAATQVSSLMYLPPTTALMAWALFGDVPGGATWAGMALVVGVAAVARPPAPPSAR